MTNHYKQVIVIRKDLNMRKGKMIAQGAHASIGALLKKAETVISGRGVFMTGIPMDLATNTWFNTGSKKIVVSVDSEQELLDLETKAKKMGLLTYLVTDSGLTEFQGPTITALAIGPDLSEKIDEVTGKLKLL